VSTTRVSKSGEAWNARITGAILIASGRVPSTSETRGSEGKTTGATGWILGMPGIGSLA